MRTKNEITKYDFRFTRYVVVLFLSNLYFDTYGNAYSNSDLY